MNGKTKTKTIKRLIAIILFIVLLILLFRVFSPSYTVWVSENPNIVIFQYGLFAHSPYISPFASHGSIGSRGYLINDEGERVYFFVSIWRDELHFYDIYTFFDGELHEARFLSGSRRNNGRNSFTLDIGGEEIIFNRFSEYGQTLNTFAWLPGLETLHGIWETEDGRLQLDLNNVTLEQTDRRNFSNFFTGSRLPRFRGVYDIDGDNIGLLISGSAGFSSSEGRFSIRISENGNLPGHSFWRVGDGREIRADAVLIGDTIYMDITSWHTNPYRCDWYLSFSDEFILKRSEG